MNKFFLTILFVLIGSSTAVAQEISSTQYFNKVIKNIEGNFTPFPSSDFEFLKPFYIEKVQFRTQTDEFELDRQEYAVRIRPGNFKLPKLQRDLFNSYYQKSQLTQSQLKIGAIEQAYELWLNLYFNQQELELGKIETSFLNDKVKVYKKQLDIPNFNILRILETEDDLHRTELEILDAKIRSGNQAGIIGQTLDISDVNVSSDLISIDKIKSIIAKSKTELVVNRFEENLLAIEQSIIEKEIALENAESQNILDFVQLQYRGPHDDFFKEKVSVSVGINLPTKSSNKLKINELKLDALKETMDVENDANEIHAEVDIAYQRIVERITTYELIKTQNENSIMTNEVLMARYETSASTSPLTLLDIQILRFRKDKRLYEAKKDIYEAYLEWLIISRKIFETPFKNYLSEDMKDLEYDGDFWGM